MTTEKKQEIINRLFAEQCSCIICNNHEIRLFHERGVKDIYRLLKEEPDFLNGSFIADKVIGKAAAALMILGGVKRSVRRCHQSAGTLLISISRHRTRIQNRDRIHYQPYPNRLVSVGESL